MDCNSGHDLAVEDDVEVVVIDDVERMSGREEEGGRVEIGRRRGERDSEGHRKRDGEK